MTFPPHPAKASTTTKFLQIKAVYLANSSGVTEYQPLLTFKYFRSPFGFPHRT